MSENTGKHITIVYSSYKPNTAPTNRLLSFIKGFKKFNIEVEVVFIYSNEKQDRLNIEGYPKLHVKYLWDKRNIKNKQLKYLFSFWDTWQYVRTLNPGTKVFILGSSEYIPFFVRRKGIEIYQERTEHYGVVQMRPSILQHRYMKAIPQFKGMFVISTALREAYVKVGAKNVVIVNMTVDANRFKGLKKTEGVEPYIAYCGTASNNKDGVDDLIKAFAIVLKSHPEVKLKIMGKAPTKDDESGNLKLVEQLGIKGKVEFTGVIPVSEIPQKLKDARIVALARPDSLQARCGFPTKLGEYLLSGNPVVVTRVGDIPMFLEDGKTALLADQRNPESFANKLLWALDNEMDAKVIGQAGREVAMCCFNYETETEKIVRTIFQE